jgi:hypothetical protein
VVFYISLVFLRYTSETPTMYKNVLSMRNTSDVIGRFSFILGVSAVNTLDAFYDIHGRKGQIFFIIGAVTAESKIIISYRISVTVKFLHTKLFFFLIFKFCLRHVIYMHLLTWVGFGLLGYVPNTLYIFLSQICTLY